MTIDIIHDMLTKIDKNLDNLTVTVKKVSKKIERDNLIMLSKSEYISSEIVNMKNVPINPFYRRQP